GFGRDRNAQNNKKHQKFHTGRLKTVLILSSDFYECREEVMFRTAQYLITEFYFLWIRND
ncbi:MAG TPA: hypothetical protein PKN56_18560, partial [Leptospiraceae bacterium]|nr:hypothetical protein [Leptospiraceae bacterium]